MKGSPMLWASLTWLMTSLFYSFQFFLRSAPNAMADQLMMDFKINAIQLGWLSSAYYIAYSLLQIPIGISLDIWGPKKILRIGTVLCVLGGVLFSNAETFSMAFMGRCLIGTGAAVSFIGSVRMNTLWFSPAYLAFAIGLLSALGKLAGGASANALLPSLMKWAPSWHYVIWGICMWGSFLTLIIWIFAKNGPQDRFVSSINVLSFKEIKTQFTQVLKVPAIWYMGLYGYALYLTLSVFSDTYSINFLCQHLGIAREQAGRLASCVMIGSAVGASTISYLSDRFRQRLIFLRGCALCTFLFSSLVFFGPAFSLGIMGIILFCLGFFSGGQILIFAVAAESDPLRRVGMATGITNALLMAGGALHNPLVGWLLQAFSHNTKDHHPIYTLFNYRIALSSLSICYIVAFIISFIVLESHPHRRSSL